tara:strand:- start:1221 stop:1619 length:399 start_codon:yes stop_codon:yes gene_type:complete
MKIRKLSLFIFAFFIFQQVSSVGVLASAKKMKEFNAVLKYESTAPPEFYKLFPTFMSSLINLHIFHNNEAKAIIDVINVRNANKDVTNIEITIEYGDYSESITVDIGSIGNKKEGTVFDFVSKMLKKKSELL